MDRILATLDPGAPRPGDSDPDPDEALRRARAANPDRRCPSCHRTFEDCRCTGHAPDVAETVTRIRLHGMGVRL